MKISNRSFVILLSGAVFALASHVSMAALSVHTNQANLRSGPALKFDVTAIAQSGEALKITGSQGDYVHVIRSNGMTGWIHAPTQGWKKSDVLSQLKPRPAAAAAPSTSTDARVIPQASAVQSAPTINAFSLTLSNIGQRQGLVFEGAYGVHSKDFFFPLPQGTQLRHGSLRVHFQASPYLNAASSLRIDINGIPVRLVSLQNHEQASFVDIPLSQKTLQRDALRLTIKAVLSNGGNRCLDERRLALYYVQILPETGINLSLEPATHLAAAWTALPSQVRLGMPETTTPSTTAALMQTTIWLRGMGRQVTFAPYPEAADIMVGSSAELARRYPSVFPQASASKTSGALALAHEDSGKPVILVSDQILANPLASQPLPWSSLLRGNQYQYGQTKPAANQKQTVDLIAAGLGETQYVSRNIEWSIDLTEPLAPADKRLHRLILNVVAAPQPQHGQQLLQIFMNGMLQEVRTLERDGRPHSLRFDLESSLQRAGINNLRIAIQRTDEQGDCRGDLSAYPVQLLPGSRVELKDTDIKPVSFNDLRAHFAKGMDVYFTPDAQKKLAAEMHMAASIFANLGLNITDGRLHFLKAGESFSPKQPFVLIGRGVAVEKSAVRLDQGRVQVLDGNNQPLLALDQMPGIGFAQMVTQQGIQGLALATPTPSTLLSPDKLHLDRDNVAFISEQGVVLTLDSREPAISKIEYPDYDGWRDWFVQYRFWLIALGWVLIGATMLGLYRKSRSRGKGE